jgi:hypothetical protein
LLHVAGGVKEVNGVVDGEVQRLVDALLAERGGAGLQQGDGRSSEAARPKMWLASKVSASQQAMTEPTKAAGLTSSVPVRPAPLNHVGMRSRCMNTLRWSSAHGRP